MDPEKAFIDGKIVFNRFNLKRKLGQGGMGEVWLAQDILLENPVALKFLPGLLVRDPDAYDWLKREAQKSMLVTHPNIVRVHDFFRTRDLAAISMEYVAGTTLASLKEDRPDGIFEPVELQPILAQICAGLAHAHERVKLVHRDLKPSNIMMAGNGDIKITDFGIAAHSVSVGERGCEQMGTSGTLVYMSPQQLMGAPPQPSDDIYALGATLYELLTGRPPFFDGDIPAQIMRAKPPLIRERREQRGLQRHPVASHWEAVIGRCLAKEPADRPVSARDVALRLLNYQSAVAVSPPASPASSPVTASTPQNSGGGYSARTGWAANSAESIYWRTIFWIGATIIAVFVGGLVYLSRNNAPVPRPIAAAPAADPAPAPVAPPTPAAAPVPSPSPPSTPVTRTPTTESVPVAPVARPPDSPALSFECGADNGFTTADGQIILVDRAAHEVGVWDRAEPAVLKRIPLAGSPACEAYSEATRRLYVAYSDGRINQITLAPGQVAKETTFVRHPLGPRAIASAGRDLVVAASIGNQARGEHYLYDSGGQRRDVSKMVYAARFFVWNERQSRLYFLSENVSPRDICFEDVGSTGRFGKHGDSTYHDSTRMAGPLNLLGRAGSVVLGSGRVFNPVSLQLEMTLPVPVCLILEYKDLHFVVEGELDPWGQAVAPTSARLHRLNASFIIDRTARTSGRPVALSSWEGGLALAATEGRTTRIVCYDIQLRPISQTPGNVH